MIDDGLQRDVLCGTVIRMNRTYFIQCAVGAGALLAIPL